MTTAEPTAEQRIQAIIDAATKARADALDALSAEQAADEPDTGKIVGLADAAALAYSKASSATAMLVKVGIIADQAEAL